MPYDGPGIYIDYEGAFQRIIGVGQMGNTNEKIVIYHSYSIHHDLPLMAEGIDFICCPLDAEDGEDAFNDRVENGQHRFVKVA